MEASNDPSIEIPVRIIVTDANDHSPEFIGTPYTVNVSEVSIPGSGLIPASKIRAIDGDQQGPFSTVEYYVEPGPFSHLVKFQSRLGGDLVLTGPLDYETLPKFTVTLRAQDQGEPPLYTTTTLTVIVSDADDQNPRFIDDKYSAILPELQRENALLNIKPKPIRAIDPDVKINSPIEYTFHSDSREYSYFTIDHRFAAIKMRKPLPSTINLPITLVIRATQTDNHDRYALTTLTIFSRRESQREPELRFHRPNYNVSVPENVPLGQVLLTIGVTGRAGMDGESDSSTSGRSGKVTYQLLDDEEGNFEIQSDGEISVRKMLDFEQKTWYSFRVMATDGKQSDVTRVNVTLLNVNDHDPQFSQAHYNFFVSESKLNSNSPIGEVKATDKDIGDTLEFTIKGPFSKIFAINKTGQLRVKSVKQLNVSQCHLIVVASDSGSPPRSSSVPVTVQFAPNIIKASSTGRSLIDSGSNLESASSEIDYIGSKTGLANLGINSVDMSALFNVTGSSAIVLVIILGILLATLFIIIITLTVHLFRHRKMSNTGSSGLSSASTDSCGSSTDSCNNQRTLSNVYSDQSRSGKSFSISSLARKNNKVGIAPEGRSLFGIPSQIPGLGMNGVENPIFNLPTSLPNNLTTRYYSSHSNSSPSAMANNNITCNKSDPDSAIASDASSAETCNINTQTTTIANNDHHHHHLNHMHSHQQIRSISASPGSSGSQDEMIIDLTRKHNQHNHKTLNKLNHHHHNNHQNRHDNGSKSSSGSVSPPPPPSITCTGTLGGSGMGGGGGGSRISVIKWPQGSIPRRVKKLTWEDETMGYNTIINYDNIDRHNRSSSHLLHGTSNDIMMINGHNSDNNCYSDDHSNNYDYSQSYMRTSNGHSRTELDPDLSVAPYRRSYNHPLNSNESNSNNHPDLTVYF